MKEKIKIDISAILVSFVIGVVGMGTPFIISLLLFGLSGINQNMVDANNLLMGIIGAPLIVLLTKNYYKKKRNTSEELDLFTLKGLKKSLVGGVIGLILPSLLFIIMILCGGKMVVNTSINWFTITIGVSTFFGMAVLEECIFRGVLKSAFSNHGTLASIIIPTLLFVMMHIDLWVNFNFFTMIELFCAGILFGVIVLQSNSLTCAVVAHALYNILSDIFFGVDSTGGIIETSMPSTVFNFPGEQVVSAMFIVVQIILIAILIMRNKARYKL